MSVRDYSQLAAEVKRAMHGLSYRQMEVKTGITTAVLHKMATGGSVSATTLNKWATAIGEDPDDWYVWGGYPEMARSPSHSPSPPPAAPPAAGWTPRTEAPDTFDDEDALLDRLYGMWGIAPPPPGPERERTKATLRAVAQVHHAD